MSEKPCGAYFFAFFENFFVPILTSGGLAAVSSSFFAALYSAFGRYDVVHIHAEGPAFFCWIPKLFGKRVISTIHGLDCPNHMLNNPNTHQNCEKCLGGHFVNCVKGKCIHGSTAKSAIGMMEAEFWKWKGRMMINGIQFIQVLLEANGLAAGKDHQFKGRYDAEKNAVIISLEKDEREW